MKPIFLIGTRAAGKTTIGKNLADKLEYDFLDLDQSLCKTQKKSIAQIVASSGWNHFRSLESEHLKSACKNFRNQSGIVVATGGGIILKSVNREILRKNGVVFWLKVMPGELYKRLSADPLPDQRPSLTDTDLLAELQQTFIERESLYSECAHHIINAENNVSAICSEIINCLHSK